MRPRCAPMRWEQWGSHGSGIQAPSRSWDRQRRFVPALPGQSRVYRAIFAHAVPPHNGTEGPLCHRPGGERSGTNRALLPGRGRIRDLPGMLQRQPGVSQEEMGAGIPAKAQPCCLWLDQPVPSTAQNGAGMVVPVGDGCAPFPAAEMGDLSFSRSCRSACPREDRQATFPGCPQALEAGGGWEKRDKDSAELLGNQEALPRPQIPPSRATTPILAREKPHQDTSCAPRRGCEGWRPRGQRQRLRLGTPELIPTLGGSRVGKIPSPRRTGKPFPLGGGGIGSVAVTNRRKPG